MPGRKRLALKNNVDKWNNREKIKDMGVREDDDEFETRKCMILQPHIDCAAGSLDHVAALC